MIRKLGGWAVAFVVFALTGLAAVKVLLIAGVLLVAALFGDSERALRNVEAVANILAVAVAYFVARKSYRWVVRPKQTPADSI